MGRRMKNNLRIINTCQTCKHCIINSPQDDGEYYYCNLDNSFKQEYHRPFSKLFYEGMNWNSDHSIESNNICDDFEVKK
jgi:hypothetical protein